ncbi:hypothetical protein H4J02_02175 [Protaetiibacter sp. SSC-01]|uniref:hypothetical protein n=1 Tax=Protaetiibacter sp. SSC-01 TaxID=2759943 RepID=UPI001656D2DE|nr:hypothetical protein [Protaetiibacter sp. SSC-01]QNO37870.1 hypothetical protein H4J02_02175 [Protaetiibacter sp. SSC-01]
MDVTDWLLDSDPAIRHQVLRDLVGAHPDAVAAERARVAHEGWGSWLLERQDADGYWDGGTYRPRWAPEDRPFFSAWTATHFTVTLLRDLGVDPADPVVREAIARVAHGVAWEEEDGGLPYFELSLEPCIVGVLLSNTVYFGFDASRTLDRALEAQLADGGWNCATDSPVSSFHPTICVVEGLLAWEGAAAADDPRRPVVLAARIRGEEYLLERRLLRRRSTGGIADPRFTMTSFPTRWHYDVLRALEHFRLARPDGDERMREAVELVRGKADADGRWPLENEHDGSVWFDMEREGEPSRWITLRALRVLRWWDGLTPR